jgi:3-oxoacyl-[acyl-carrier-protein] synthase-1
MTVGGLEVLSAGIRTALGSGAVPVAMLARCRRVGIVPSLFYTPEGAPVQMALCEGLPPALRGVDRLVGLAAPALGEAVREAHGVDRGRPLPVWLDVSPGAIADVPAFLELVSLAADAPVDAVRSGIVAHGGGVEVFARAAALLHSPAPDRPEAVIVGGVDSYNDWDRAATMARRRRIRADGTSDGAPPSEGAAFLVLARPRDGGECGARCCLVPAREPAPAAWVVSDVDGRDRALSWEELSARAGLGAADHRRPLERLGDVGAATGAMLVALAHGLWRAGCVPAGAGLVTFGEPRAFVELSFQGGGSGRTTGDAVAAPRSPAQRFAIAARDVLARIDALPRGTARWTVARRLDSLWAGLGRIESASPFGDGQIDDLERARTLTDEALAATRGTPGTPRSLVARLEAVVAHLPEARKAVAEWLARSAAPPAGDAERPFQASLVGPRLHALAAPRARPFDALARALRAAHDEDFDENDAAAQPPPAERTARHLALRGCMDAMARYRPRGAGDPVDPRVLAHLDAIVALARPRPGWPDDDAIDLVAEAAAYAAEWPEQPGAGFVHAFVLGCLEGVDAARAAVMGLHGCTASVREARIVALGLASSPWIVPTLVRLCTSGDPDVVEAALRVMDVRRDAPSAAVALLGAHPQPRIHEAATRLLARRGAS